MGRKTDYARHKELIETKIAEVGPRMMNMMFKFIEDHYFDEENPESMKLAHKGHGKWFDSQIPKKQVIETKTEIRVLDPRFEKAMDMVTAESVKAIEMEEAEIISIEDALEAKNAAK